MESDQWRVKPSSSNLDVLQPPAWMIELAEQVKMIEPGIVLPTGVIVGTAVIEKVIRVDGCRLPVGKQRQRIYW